MSNERQNSEFCILIAEDDPDDQHIMRQAFTSVNLDENLQTFSDGIELLDYLHKRGKYKDTQLPEPRVILLDLNMPKKDGRECLKEIKSTSDIKKIPVIVYSTSSNPDDISFAHEHGASSYIIKPYSYQELVKIMEVFKNYWFNIVKTSSN